MSATIKDIAAAAGVSRGTVDRVLHNRPGVNPEVAETVRQVIRSMGFKPNRAGKMLAARKQPLKIGCFFPGAGNRFFDDVAAGFTEAGDRYGSVGLTLEIKTTGSLDACTHIAAMQRLVDDGCGALCVTTIDTPETREFIDGVIADGIPVVTVNTDLTRTQRLCYVGCDYAQGGRTAAGMLMLFGLPRLNLLIVAGSLQIKGHTERIRGFSETIKLGGAAYNLVDIIESLDNDEHAYATAKSVLRQHGDINSIYIASAASEGVCRAVSELGLHNKLRIITHDDTPAVRELLRRGAVDATLTQEPYSQGFTAVEKLVTYFMDGRDEPPGDFITQTTILIRENLD